MDDEFIGPGARGRERARQIGEEMLRRGLRLAFNIFCRPDNVDVEIVRLLKAAGLDCVDVGIESFVPRQLALYGKRIDAERNASVLRDLKTLGLAYRVYVIAVDPYLTREEYLLTVRAMRKTGLEHFYDASAFTKLARSIQRHPGH